MSPDQIESFLAEPRHAVVGVVRSDGAPQLSPVWILYEKGLVYFSIFVDSAKYRQLERDSRISICVDAGHPDARAVMIQGTAELARETSASYEDLSWRINRRYHESDEAARKFMEQTKAQGPGALVIVSPEKIIGRNYN
jgi:PPOX class probable F420-dependent enzyme